MNDPSGLSNLNRIADEILLLHQRLATAYAEIERVQHGLRQWQTDHAATCRRDLDRQPDHTRWPVNGLEQRRRPVNGDPTGKGPFDQRL